MSLFLRIKISLKPISITTVLIVLQAIFPLLLPSLIGYYGPTLSDSLVVLPELQKTSSSSLLVSIH